MPTPKKGKPAATRRSQRYSGIGELSDLTAVAVTVVIIGAGGGGETELKKEGPDLIFLDPGRGSGRELCCKEEKLSIEFVLDKREKP